MTDDEFDSLVERADKALDMMGKQPKTELIVDGSYACETPACIQCGLPLRGPRRCDGSCEE